MKARILAALASLTVRDITAFAGSVSLVVGVGLIYVPAAFIVAGVGLLTLSIRGV